MFSGKKKEKRKGGRNQWQDTWAIITGAKRSPSSLNIILTEIMLRLCLESPV